jgi:hypothetical protein
MCVWVCGRVCICVHTCGFLGVSVFVCQTLEEFNLSLARVRASLSFRYFFFLFPPELPQSPIWGSSSGSRCAGTGEIGGGGKRCACAVRVERERERERVRLAAAASAG